MPWFRVDDKLHSHPKIVALFDGPCAGDALALWTLSGSWASDQRTDGFVPGGQAKRFGFKGKAASELVRVGLWVAVEGGYQFHQYLERNPSRAQLDSEKERSNARVAALREREKQRCNGVTNAYVTPAPVPSHSLSQSQREEEKENCERFAESVGPPKPPPKLTRWRLVFEIWAKHVHGGKPAGQPGQHKKHLESLLRDAEARKPDDPLGLIEETLVRYIPNRREKGLLLELRFFATDFASWADHQAGNGNGKAPKTAIVLEYEAANLAYLAAKKSGDKAAIKRWDSELEHIGKRMSGHA